MDDIQKVANAAVAGVRSLQKMQRAAGTIKAGQAWLVQDAFLAAYESLKASCQGDVISAAASVVPALMEARTKHRNADSVKCCGVTRTTACETAIRLAVQVNSLLEKIICEGVDDKAYIEECAGMISERGLDCDELEDLAAEIETEWYWAGEALWVHNDNKPSAQVAESGSDEEKPPSVNVKQPTEKALQAWRLQTLLGINDQTELAQKLTQNGVSATQGQVSRWLKQVKDYLEAGNVLPGLPTMSKTQTVDPSVIDMGERKDRRTPRPSDLRDDS